MNRQLVPEDFAATVTLAIPTYRRRKSLLRTLQDVAALANPPDEVLIVDQSPPEERFPIAGDLERLRGLPFRLLHLDPPSLPAARNAALREAGSDLVLFLDDDVRVESDLVRLHRRHYRNAEIGAVGGRVLEEPDRITNYRRRPGGYLSLTGRGLRNFNDARISDTDWAAGGNLSVRRRAALACGGFDPGYGGSAMLEDADFCYRLRRAGYRILYDGEAAILHLREPEGGCRLASMAETEYWRYRNTMRFHCRNLPPYRRTISAAALIAAGFKNAIIGRFPPAHLPQVLRGLVDGNETCGEETLSTGKTGDWSRRP